MKQWLLLVNLGSPALGTDILLVAVRSVEAWRGTRNLLCRASRGHVKVDHAVAVIRAHSLQPCETSHTWGQAEQQHILHLMQVN